MQYEFRRLGDGRQAVLRETMRAVTPFGGLVTFIEYLRASGMVEAIREHLPFRYRSNNALPPEYTLVAFWLGVLGGARRFSQLQMLRCDRALRTVCGVRAFPSDDTVRNFFRRFGPGEVARFFLPLWRWWFEQYPGRRGLLDLDSTLCQRFGHQEGAERGYNPTRRHGRSHRPLLAFLSEPVVVLHGWLRAGNSSDTRGAVEFLQEALDHLPAGYEVQGLRADCGFFDQALLEFLEARRVPYVVVVRRKETIQRQLRYLTAWRTLDPTYAVGEFTFQMPTWKCARRFVVLRIRLPDDCRPALFHEPGYDYRVFVTNRAEPAEWIWHHYDQRAAIEPRFSELKEDLAADDFCLHQFHATEAAFRSILFVFNLLSLLQALQPTAGASTTRPAPSSPEEARSSRRPQCRPATLRSTLFLCGAIAGRSGHKTVLFLSQAWGGLQTRKPLLDIIAHLKNPTSPKLNFTPATAPP